MASISGARAVADTGHHVLNFTCSDGVAIYKGDILSLDDDMTVSGAAQYINPAFAGIAVADKIALDGSTTLGCDTSGVWEMSAGSSAILKGALVCLSGANVIDTATASGILAGAVIGKALEQVGVSGLVKVQVGVY